MPNTIEENVERLKAVVPVIKNSIIIKGGTVNSGDGLEEFADDVLSIKNELTDISITSNGEYYSGEETTLTTTTFPVTVLDTVGTPLKHVDVIGNANQSGTPTPDNPIIPQGTGDMTGNLADLYGVNKSALSLTFRTVDNMRIVIDGKKGNGNNVVSIKTPNISIPAGTYTVKIKMVDGHIENMPESGYGVLFGINKNTYLQRTTPGVLNIGDVGTRTFTLSEDTVISSFDITPGYAVDANGPIFNNATFECWFYAGTGDEPYEPYGIKIPISNGGENLWDEDYTGINTNAIYRPLFVGDGVFTLSTNFKLNGNITDIFLLSGNVSSGISSSINGAYEGKNITVQSVDGYITIAYRANARPSSGSLPYCKTMLNRGSTPLPYESYRHITTSTYLGEVETVRYVKKLVLDGTEDFQSISSGNNKYFRLSVEDFGEIHIDTTYCTHFESVSITSSTTNVGVGVIHSSVLNKDALGIRPPQVSTTSLEDFTTYLTQQYNNGTPVTVWYVLATPTTGIVNEPLMKIGEYADELSIDTNIPLAQNTKNIINIDTTLKPSSASFTYNKKRTYIGYNKITVSVSDVVDGRIFIVTTIPNATVTISNTSNTYTQTANSVGEAVFENISAGSYTITATYDDAVSDTTTITVVEHSIIEDTFATLTISASNNTTITVTNGTIAKTITYTGTPIVQYVSLGTWDLSCIIDGITVTRTASVDTYTNQDILLEPIPQTVSRYVDFTSNTTTITGDPDTHPVYMNINRCNVSDDGTINAYYGDVSYTEDGSNGQVMVKIPKFYYKVTPDSDGGLDGVNIRKCTWEISDIPQTGFTLHPAFYDANGNEIDYFLYGAFDGVGQNAEGTYDTSYNKSFDKLSSVAGSSYIPSNSMTRATARTMAANRGTGWYQAAVKQTMAVQMLFAVEYGFNSQVSVGNGVTNASAAVYAGQTTGNITSGTRSNEITPVNWRGIENFWGNIFDWIDGLNINERVPYVCDNYTFVDNTLTGYTQISFSLPVSNYITALGYDSTNDWVMLPSESSSTSNPNGPIGDYVLSYAGWRVALLGGRWTYGSLAGAFCWDCGNTSSAASAAVGARLMYIPSAV